MKALTVMGKTITDCISVAMNTVVAFVVARPIIYVAPELVPAALVAMTLTILASLVTTLQEQKLMSRRYGHSEKTGGVVFDLLSGAQCL